jgi:ABC-2 type transport system ATP-binding protein
MHAGNLVTTRSETTHVNGLRAATSVATQATVANEQRSNAVTAEGLVKVYGAGESEVRALDGLDLTVPEGSVLGLLGPNGAGKTTTVRILATLLQPDAGSATVAGFDVLREAQQLRAVIGLSGQYAAVDENLTGRENLTMFARLYQLPKSEARKRANDLLEQFDLVDASGRPVKTYSGGMRRRLDLASALIGRPRVLFLDEPTTGLDPRSRIGMWNVIRDSVREGTTVLLTTQYLEEADELADSIAVVDHGKIIARGTADELKAQIGGERIEVVVRHDDDVMRAFALLSHNGEDECNVEKHARRLTIPAHGGAERLVQVVRELDEASIAIDDVGLRRPTLDDVFLALTGHVAEEAPTDGDAAVSEA